MLALTDHDTLSGLEEARAAARVHGVQLIDGVEVSVTWCGCTVHVLGLAVDPADAGLRRGLEIVRGGRLERVEAIARRLEGIGIPGALDGAMALASRPAAIGRMHFARFLVASGVARDLKEAFGRFLGEGKPGYVRHEWARLAEAIGWIRKAGGIAVLAHPGRLRLRIAQLRTLLQEFRAAGGSAVEAVRESGSDGMARRIAALAARTGLALSVGSDFHAPDENGIDLGRVPDLPAGSTPVWRVEAGGRFVLA